MTPLPRRRALALIATIPAGLTAFATPARAAEHHVDISGRKFRPGALTIRAGDSVTWENADRVGHTATADDKSWTTPNLRRGAAASVTFAEKGEFPYHCRWHRAMRGTIIVT